MKQGAEDFGFLFKCPGTWFGVFRPSFPKLPQYLNTCETGTARHTEGNDTRVRSYLMWNKELKTLDYISGVLAHDLWYSGPVSQCLSTCETGVIQPIQGLDTRVRSHLIWNIELKTLDYLSFDSVHDIGLFGPFFPFFLFALMPKSQTDITQSLDDLGRRVRPHLMWNIQLKTMDYFRCVLPHDLGYFIQVSPNLPDAKIP